VITTSAAELRAALPEGGALMGLDPGTKTIGVALCDRDWRFATAGKTIQRRKFAADKAQLAAQITERSVKGLVIGLPLHMDGSESPRSQAARGTDVTFIALLRKGDLALALTKAFFLCFTGFVVAAWTTHALHILR
jgi:hypothetical protein